MRRNSEEERQRRIENQRRIVAQARELQAARNKPTFAVQTKLTAKEYEMFEKYCAARGETKCHVLRSIIQSISNLK